MQEKIRNTDKNIFLPDPRIEFFNSHALNWDTMGPDPEETIRKLRQIEPRLGFRSGMRIIEIGCGTGQITGWLSDIVGPNNVLATDFSPAMIEVAKSKNINAEFKVMDICVDFAGDEEFEVAFCFNSFPHFRDKIAALKNIHRSLIKDGFLIVLHFSGSRELNEFHKSIGGAVTNDFLPVKEEWDSLLLQTRYTLVEFEDRPDLFFLRAKKQD